MDIFIRATGNISPQNTFGMRPFLSDFTEHEGNRLLCIEPDYKVFIDPKLIRRMSRIIKMGVAAASSCLKEAGVEMPDAIITGTAYGCLEDTGVFLNKMVVQQEELLTPTAFIQSTHNTVGAQIALMLHCHNYNNTYVHRGFSFENALLDAMLVLREGNGANVLVGAVDEITDLSHTILNRFGLYKQEKITNKNLFISNSKGTIAGEGAAFFLLSNEQSKDNYAKLDAVSTFYKPNKFADVENEILAFLKNQGTDIGELDLIIEGRNGDLGNDQVYEQLGNSIFSKTAKINYKHLCGEFPSSVAFAFWMGANIIRGKALPIVFGQDETKSKRFKRILIYNHYQHIHHSLLLISAC